MTAKRMTINETRRACDGAAKCVQTEENFKPISKNYM